MQSNEYSNLPLLAEENKNSSLIEPLVIGGGGGSEARSVRLPPGMDGYLSPRETQKVTNLSRTSIWRLENLGLFPRRRKIGAGRNGRVGYLRSEVSQWLASREAA
jgi:predicted DNA-binding transcriptional regulator AlpA